MEAFPDRYVCIRVSFIIVMAKQGLYSNINAKRKRIEEGSGEKMRKAGSKGAPTEKDFKKSAKTAKKNGKKG